MSRIARFAVLVAALMSLFAVMSSSAGAVTWHNTGDTAFTATSGAGTLSVTSASLACTGSDASGTTAATPFVGATWAAATGTATFTNCAIAGIPTSVDCGYTLTASSQSGGVSSGNVDANCGVYQFGAQICVIHGQTPGSYTNPSGTTAGKLTLNHSATLKTTNGSGGTCPLGANEPSTLTTFTYTITNATGGASTPHLGPIVTRTA